MRLVLFDIDGTLLDCGPQVRGLFGRSLEEVFGTAGPIDGYEFCGRTDLEIVLDLTAAAGIPLAAVRRGLPRMKALYLERLGRLLDAAEMRLLPAVGQILESLAARTDVCLGLITGNWRAGAGIKLARLGLDGYFACGAFGDGQPDRMELPLLAMRRAAAVTGREFRPADCLIVGDSPADVACARAHGIAALAVATGRTPAERLAAAGARWVLPCLTGGTVRHPAFGAASA